MDKLQGESFIWFPGWGGNSYGLLPIVEKLSFGLHYLVDPKSTDLESLTIETWVSEIFKKLPSNRKWNVMGISMGGLLAQEFTKQFPSHVKSLHLLCTNTGGKNNPYALNPETLKRWFSQSDDISDPLDRILRVCFTQDSIDSEVYQNYLSYLRKDPSPVVPKISRAQHRAVLEYSSRSFLSSIDAPTFIYIGEKDEVVPLDASLELLSSIKGSHLFKIDGGHFFFLEKSEVFENHLIKSFEL
ncbi:MAG: hypothetical protein COB02_16080 [Candidatus Cloacimonadota bacterium]|nr:MAG: hypothetical protein COB02_16080 [Candidatus Cloacimonadota bacterium]